MVFPVIPVAVALGAGALLSAYKGVKAVKDNNSAEELNESSKDMIQRYTAKLNSSREMCEKLLEGLGATKYEVLTNHIQNFIVVFEKIKNIEVIEREDLEKIKLKEFSDQVLKELKHDVSLLTNSSIALAGGAATGAMVAFGAYNGTMALAAAGTGTLISELSGAAATNATLAWLGGGTLSAGGFGMAGGAIMLNALAIIPGLLIASWYMGNKSEKKLNDAKANKELAEKYRKDAETSITFTTGIADIAASMLELFSILKKFSRRSTKKLNEIINTYGVDYSQYDEETKHIVLKSIKIVQLLKCLIDTPILNEKGELLNDVKSNVKQIEKDIKLIN